MFSGPAIVCGVVRVEETPFRLASAPDAVDAPVPPLSVETGIERAIAMFPLEPPPVRPVPAITPVIVPLLPLARDVPGNICPGAKVICPFGEIESPVCEGVVVPDPKSSARLAVGLVVLLPVLCACQTKFCGTAVLFALE